jgi:hypothetical protein
MDVGALRRSPWRTRRAMPAQKQEWGGKLVHFEDPAGNVLTLVG